MSIDFNKMKKLTDELTSRLNALKKKAATEHLTSYDHFELNYDVNSLTMFMSWPFPESEVQETSANTSERDFKGNWTYLRQLALKNSGWDFAEREANDVLQQARKLLEDHPIKYTAEELQIQKTNAEYATIYRKLMNDFALLKYYAKVRQDLVLPGTVAKTRNAIWDAKEDLQIRGVPSQFYLGCPGKDFEEIEEFIKQYDKYRNDKYPTKPVNPAPAAIVPMYQAAAAANAPALPPAAAPAVQPAHGAAAAAAAGR